MILILILFCSVILALIYFNPYIDFFNDYRGNTHIVIWYDFKNKRKFIDLTGDQK